MYVLSVLGVLGLVLGVGGQEDCKSIDIDIGSTWLNISWLLHCEISPEDVLFVRSYHVKLEDVSTGYYNYTLNVFCTRTSCTQYIENLRSCIKYNVSLQAEMDDGELFDYNSQEIVLKEELPSTPQNLLISDETSSSLQVSWVPPQEGEYCVHHYKVCLNDLTSNQEYQVSLETEELSLEIKELQACVGYGVTVTPVTGSGNEGRMVSTSGATSFENPSRPSQLRPKDSGSNYVSFYWVPGSNYSSCLRGTSALCVQSEFQDQPAVGHPLVEPSTRTSIESIYSEVSHLKECTNYKCSVQVPSLNGDWIKSEEIDMTTSSVGVNLGSPQYLEYNTGEESIWIFWKPPRIGAACIKGYFVSWESSSEQTVYLEGNHVNEFQITGLSACTVYTLSIIAYSADWGVVTNSTAATVQVSTAAGIPGPVSNVHKQSSDDLILVMCWNPPSQFPNCVKDYSVEISSMIQFNKTTTSTSIIQFNKTTSTSTRQQLDEICRAYEVQDCSTMYRFCISPESVSGRRGPATCVDNIESAQCKLKNDL